MMEATKNVANLKIIHALYFLCLCMAAAGDPSFHPSHKLPGPFPLHQYTRYADVAEHCEFVFPYTTVLREDDDRSSVLMEQLSFVNGDWSQDDDGAPLLPFEGSHADAGPESLDTVRLATFVLTHMDTVRWRGERKALNVSGILSLAITRNSSWPMENGIPSCATFGLRSGVAELHIPFEGVYVETRNSNGGGGERVLCMLGHAARPMRGGNSSDPWDWAKRRDQKPNMVADDKILLVLRYPYTHTLTTRAVRGEMMSACTESARSYFNDVRLASRLRSYFSRYQFLPEVLEFTTSQNCSLLPVEDRLVYRGGGASFCDILHHQLVSVDKNGGVLDVVPNWSSNSTDEGSCSSRIGPFETTPSGSTAAFARSAIAVQSLQCEPAGDMNARVSAVFRLVAPREHRPTSVRRTGLGAATLSAEGTWSASTGRLCMVACGGAERQTVCHHRITLHVPTTFSVTRRAVVVGQITSRKGSHAPLTFRKRVGPAESWHRFDESHSVAYEYTKVELLRQRESPRDHHFIANLFLQPSYPKVAAAADDDLGSLSNLADNLSFGIHCRSKCPEFVPEWIDDPFLEFQILSIGRLVGRYYEPPFQFQDQEIDGRDGRHGLVEMNVSAEITASSGRNLLGPTTVMSLEGVYNTRDGRMHLIGCRDVVPDASLSTSRDDLEDGMDCSIEVTVEYPPTTTRWLSVSPVAKVYVASTRDAGDPLHFDRAELHTIPIMYSHQQQQPHGELTESQVEELLSIAVLSATIAATASQLQHVRAHPDVGPYISLGMLGVQALGHIATLVMDAKTTLPVWPPASSYTMQVDHRTIGWNMGCSVKALTVAALLLTARLAHKVRRSRARSTLEPGSVPSDAPVILYSFAVHLAYWAVHWLGTEATLTTPPTRVVYEGAGEEVLLTPPSHSHVAVEWYADVVNPWFLLPQVIGNAVWRVGCKPLAARYYAGFTAAWLLPRIYSYLRPPVGMYYYDWAHDDDVMNLYSKVGAVVVPAVGLALAVIVYLQQRFNYKIVGWARRTGQNKLQHEC